MQERLQPGNSEQNFLPNPHPKEIVNETGVILPLYLADVLDDQEYALSFFKGPTMNFLADASRGFLLSKTLKLTNASKPDLAKLISHEKDLANDNDEEVFPQTRSLESFGTAMIIFGLMPDLASPNYNYFMPILNKMALIPPRNSIETLERLDELKIFIEEIVSHKLQPKDLRRLCMEDKIYRPMAFFQVGKDLPIKQEPTKNQVIEMLQELRLN